MGGGAPTAVTRVFGKRTARVWWISLATPLDGTVRVSATVPSRGAIVDVALVGPNRRTVVRRAQWVEPAGEDARRARSAASARCSSVSRRRGSRSGARLGDDCREARRRSERARRAADECRRALPPRRAIPAHTRSGCRSATAPQTFAASAVAGRSHRLVRRGGAGGPRAERRRRKSGPLGVRSSRRTAPTTSARSRASCSRTRSRSTLGGAGRTRPRAAQRPRDVPLRDAARHHDGPHVALRARSWRRSAAASRASSTRSSRPVSTRRSRSTSSTTTARATRATSAGRAERDSERGRRSRSSTTARASESRPPRSRAHEFLHTTGAVSRQRAARRAPAKRAATRATTRRDLMYPFIGGEPLVGEAPRPRPGRLLRARRRMDRTRRTRRGSCSSTRRRRSRSRSRVPAP